MKISEFLREQRELYSAYLVGGRPDLPRGVEDHTRLCHELLIQAIELERQADEIQRLKAAALTWIHGEDCHGYADDDREPPAPECDCGIGDILRAATPRISVTVDRDTGATIVSELGANPSLSPNLSPAPSGAPGTSQLSS